MPAQLLDARGRGVGFHRRLHRPGDRSQQKEADGGDVVERDIGNAFEQRRHGALRAHAHAPHQRSAARLGSRQVERDRCIDPSGFGVDKRVYERVRGLLQAGTVVGGAGSLDRCALVLAGVAIVAGCASIRTTAGDGRMQAHEVSVSRTTVLPGRIKDVFDFIAAEEVLPKVLTGYGPLPAVVATSGLTGPWSSVGSQRVTHLADGSTAREQVTHYERPGRFAYRIWEFDHPILKRLATSGRGDWTFEQLPQGTRVVWTYTFTATGPLAALPLSGVAQLLWRGYMDVCLENADRLLGEAQAANASLARLPAQASTAQ